jgi:hypothetical protein
MSHDSLIARAITQANALMELWPDRPAINPGGTNWHQVFFALGGAFYEIGQVMHNVSTIDEMPEDWVYQGVTPCRSQVHTQIEITTLLPYWNGLRRERVEKFGFYQDHSDRLFRPFCTETVNRFDVESGKYVKTPLEEALYRKAVEIVDGMSPFDYPSPAWNSSSGFALGNRSTTLYLTYTRMLMTERPESRPLSRDRLRRLVRRLDRLGPESRVIPHFDNGDCRDQAMKQARRTDDFRVPTSRPWIKARRRAALEEAS